MAYCHRNCGDNRRTPHISCAPNNRAGPDHLYRGLGADDWRNRDCVRHQAAPGNQRRMVFDPYGSGIHRLCHTASVEPYRRRGRGDLARRMVRGCTRHSCDLLWLPAEGIEACVISVFLVCRDTFSDRDTLVSRSFRMIRPAATSATITLRRWNMIPLILRVEFLKAGVPGLLNAYEKSFYSQNATGKRFAS